jgi:hypothetical protein
MPCQLRRRGGILAEEELLRSGLDGEVLDASCCSPRSSSSSRRRIRGCSAPSTRSRASSRATTSCAATTLGFPPTAATAKKATFWLSEAQARAGRLDEARLTFEKMLGYANLLGLYSEDLTGEALGNFPQRLRTGR